MQLSIQLCDDAQEPLGLILPGGCTLLHEGEPAYVKGEVGLVGSLNSHKGVAHAHVAGDQGDAVLVHAIVCPWIVIDDHSNLCQLSLL